MKHRVLLAAVVAVLVLSGCGENRSDPLMTESTAQGEAEVVERTPASNVTAKARSTSTEPKQSSTTAAPTTAAAPTTKATPAPTTAPPTTAAVYYKNCTAARDAGAAPIRRGEPGYGSHLDRDGDGIACE